MQIEGLFTKTTFKSRQAALRRAAQAVERDPGWPHHRSDISGARPWRHHLGYGVQRTPNAASEICVCCPARTAPREVLQKLAAAAALAPISASDLATPQREDMVLFDASLQWEKSHLRSKPISPILGVTAAGRSRRAV